MSTAYAVCLIAVAFHLIAVPALVYAIKTRQLRESDREAYRTVQGKTASTPPRAPRVPRVQSQAVTMRPVSRLQVRLFFGLIITMLLLMCAAQVYLAVAASRAPSAMTATN